MKISERIMGMSATIEILDNAKVGDFDEILDFFHNIETLFSPYNKNSELSKINTKRLTLDDASPVVRKVFKLCEQTKIETKGYFDIAIERHFDPSGLVKGYAMNEASTILQKKGYRNYYIGIGNDVEIRGLKNGKKWRVGIPNPYDLDKILVINAANCGIATSMNSLLKIHIYNPIRKRIVSDILSVTIIAPNIYEADRLSTACYAMGENGIEFIENLKDFEGVMVSKKGKILNTSGFSSYL